MVAKLIDGAERGRIMKRCDSWCILTCLCLAPRVALAQASRPALDEPAAAPASQPAGASVAAPAEGARLVALDELSFNLGFSGEWRRRDVRSDGGGAFAPAYRQTNRERRFEETIGLEGGGALFDPRVFQFDFAGLWGLSQEAFRETRPGPDLRASPAGEVLEYDLSGVLFPEGKLTTQLFASQLDDRVPRPFLPSLERRRERYGFEMTYNDAVLPMRLRYEDSYEELESGTRGYVLDDEQRSEQSLEYEATWHLSERQQLRLEYQYSDRHERYSGTSARFDTVRNHLTLDHQLSFGLDSRSRLETIARFQDETGDLARDVYELAPQLRLQHSETLATIFKLQYLRDSFEGVDQDLYRGDVGFDFTYDDAWNAAVNLFGSHVDAERGGDVTEWGGSGRLSYDRDNAWGRFRASFGYEHAQTRHDDGGRDGLVIGESLTLDDPALAYLAREFPILSSLVVTSVDRTRVYWPGRDYLVIRLGRYAALRRVPTGRISDGETVLVNYRYRTSEAFESTRDRMDFRIEQKFRSGWKPYYSGTVQFESIDRTRFLAYGPRDVCRHRLGLRYEQPKWSAGGEYEFNDDSVDPYHAARLSGDVTLLSKAPHDLSVRGDLSYFDFSGENGLRERDTLLLDLATSYRLSLYRDLDLTFGAAYRYEDDSLFGLTHGVDVNAAVEWKIGLLTALFEVEYDLLDLSNSRDGEFAAWFKVRRDIPILAGK